MGALREKAEAEKAKQYEDEAAAAEKVKTERRAEASKRVAAAAKYLARWSGEDVSADDLTLVEREGPPTWSVGLDGFSLEISVIGKGSEKPKYDIWQMLSTGDKRPVEKPKTLLDPVGMR